MSRDPQTLRDTLLVVRCQLGEPAAFDELVERWHGPLASFLRRLVNEAEEAEDLLQETWLGILRGLPRLRDRERFAAWAFQIARHAMTSRLRRRGRRETDPVELDELPAPLPEPERLVDLRRLERALARLPRLEREAVVLFHFEGLKLDEVAQVTSVATGTVKSRLFRARRRLREELEPTPSNPQKGRP